MTNYIGIDISKKTLQGYVPVNNQSLCVPNTPKDFNNLWTCITQNLPSLSQVIIVFEPTGGYEKPLRDFPKSHQINFTTVHPHKVRQYAKAKGILAKADSLDSKLLHDYAVCFSLEMKTQYHRESGKTP